MEERRLCERKAGERGAWEGWCPPVPPTVELWDAVGEWAAGGGLVAEGGAALHAAGGL